MSKKLELAYQQKLHNEEYSLHFKDQIIAKSLMQIIGNAQMPIQQTITPQLQPDKLFNQQPQMNAASIQMEQLISYLSNLNKGY